MIIALAAGVSMAAWCGSATAQGVELYVGPSYDPYYGYSAYGYGDYYYGPRVYGYRYEPDERHLRPPENYRPGSTRWWRQMDRFGRGGHQD
jgi:hypothetical protein